MVLGGLVLALALPITIVLTQQQQDLRQRASSNLVLVPCNSNVSIYCPVGYSCDYIASQWRCAQNPGGVPNTPTPIPPTPTTQPGTPNEDLPGGTGGTGGVGGQSGTSFNFNNGLSHCRPSYTKCDNGILNQTDRGSCSDFLPTGKICTANTYPDNPPNDNNCSTIAPDGSIRYCLPQTFWSIPANVSGWTHKSNSDGTCNTYNGTTTNSRCYISPYKIPLKSPVLTATNISISQNNLSWTTSFSATSYKLLYCTGSNCTPNLTIPNTTSTTSHQHVNLNCATTFRYMVQAIRGTTTANSNVATATTGACFDPCAVSTNKPNSCECTSNSQCSSQYCSPNNPRTCQAAPTNTPTPTATKTPTPTATKTPTPTSTPTPTTEAEPETDPSPSLTQTPEAIIALEISLPAIASNVPEEGQGTLSNNENPVRTSRNVQVLIGNSSGANVTSLASGSNEPVSGTLTFDPATFTYKGFVSLGNLPTANYQILVRTDNSLYRQADGFPLITLGQTTTIPQMRLFSGDIDRSGSSDNDMTIDDYIMFMACFRELEICTPEAKIRADLDDNGQIDVIDLNIMQRTFASREGDSLN